MSEYSEYGAKAAKGGHKKPGPGGDEGNGGSSGCMVATAPAAVVLAGIALAWKVARR